MHLSSSAANPVHFAPSPRNHPVLAGMWSVVAFSFHPAVAAPLFNLIQTTKLWAFETWLRAQASQGMLLCACSAYLHQQCGVAGLRLGLTRLHVPLLQQLGCGRCMPVRTAES